MYWRIKLRLDAVALDAVELLGWNAVCRAELQSLYLALANPTEDGLARNAEMNGNVDGAHESIGVSGMCCVHVNIYMREMRESE